MRAALSLTFPGWLPVACLGWLLLACGRPAEGAAGAGQRTGGGEAGARADAGPPAPFYGDRATLVEARPGDAFTVVLTQDPTGQQAWLLDPAHDHTVARLEAEGELQGPPAGCETCSPGAQRYYHFVATGLGRVDARFRLKPEGDVTAPFTREVVIQMRVETTPHWAE